MNTSVAAGAGGDRFLMAMNLNPDNAVADINLRFNTALQHHSVLAVEVTKEIERALGKFPTVEVAMTADGPFDEIEHDYKLGAGVCAVCRWQARRCSSGLWICDRISPSEARMAMAGDLPVAGHGFQRGLGHPAGAPVGDA